MSRVYLLCILATLAISLSACVTNDPNVWDKMSYGNPASAESYGFSPVDLQNMGY